jgi:hypothetical protein
LVKVSVLMALSSIRSQRAFCQRPAYDLLFKWFVKLRIDGAAFDSWSAPTGRQRNWAGGAQHPRRPSTSSGASAPISAPSLRGPIEVGPR